MEKNNNDLLTTTFECQIKYIELTHAVLKRITIIIWFRK